MNLAIEQLKSDNNTEVQKLLTDTSSSSAFGELIGTVLTASSTSWLGTMLGKWI